MALRHDPYGGTGTASDAAAAVTTVDAGSDAPIVLPSGRFATDAEFLQQGDDLLLVGPDGTMVVVRDYFLTDTPPDLLTPEGGRLTASLVHSFTPPEAVAQLAQRGDGDSEPIGQVSSALGTVFVVRASGAREQLGAGDAVFQGDVIETAEGGAVNLLFIDKTTFALGADARLALDELVFNPETHEGQSTFSILKGVFVFASGQIAKADPADMTVKTTVATIGIRGTKVAGEVNPAGEISKFTILEGKIIVTTNAGSVELTDANETTFVSGFNAPPSASTVLSDSEINDNYGEVKGVSGNYFNAGIISGDGASAGNSEGGGDRNGADGEGDPDLDTIADTVFDLAPAAGGEGEGEAGGEGNSEGEGEGGSIVSSSGDEFNPVGGGEGSGGFGGGTGGAAFGAGAAGGATGGGGSQSSGPTVLPQTGEGEPGGVNTLTGTPGTDILVGASDRPNIIDGLASNDTIVGGGLGDTLIGGAGNDSLTGGAGNDVFIVSSGADVIRDSEGIDRIVLTGLDADLSQFGGNSRDGDDLLIQLGGETVRIVDHFGAGTVESITFETVTGESRTLTLATGLNGGNADGIITGTDGDDTLDGGGGDDVLFGAGGDDVLLGNDGDDSNDGGSGFDTLDFSSAVNGITIDIDAGTATGGDEIGNDTFVNIERFIGGGGDDLILGGGGGDTIFGGAGGDGLVGNDGDDVIDGGAGADGIDGGSGDDSLFGGEGDDVIAGGAGVDTLEGGAGADTLDGGAGGDALFGNDGDDAAIVTLGGTQGIDSIDGGSGSDSLTVNLTEEQFADPQIATELAALRDFILANPDTQSGNGQVARFDALGLEVGNLENVEILVDGVPADLDALAPTLSVTAASGDEDAAIALDIAASLTDTDGSELLTVTIDALPEGASLSAGTENEDGSVTLTPAELIGLTVTPPANSDEDFELSVTAQSTERSTGDIATTSAALPVTVAAVADAPVLNVNAAAGNEDNAIALDITAALSDASEVLSITISDIPEGANLSAGTSNEDGTVTLTPEQLDGLTVTPPADSSDDFSLSITAVSRDGADTAAVTAILPVTVLPVADAPSLSAAAAPGVEDAPITLDIAAALTDPSEILSLTISDIPDGATLSDGNVNEDGSVTLTASQLAGLSITPAANSSSDFSLTVTAVSVDGADTAQTAAVLPVTVAPVADAPNLTVAPASGDGDNAVALDISASLNDLDETLSVNIADIPEGAVLSAGTVNPDGTVTVTPVQLSGLTITPAPNSSEPFALSVTAVSADGDDTATTTLALPVTLTAVADAPVLEVSPASGDEDTAIALDIAASLTDPSEVLSITVDGLPEGASLSAGTRNADGSVTLTPEELFGLSVSPANNDSDDFTLSVTAISLDGIDTAATTTALPVSVTPVADAPSLTVSSAAATEDTAIALDITAALTDPSEVLSVTISDIPQGASLSAGTVNEDGSITLTPAELVDLTVTPAENSDEDFTLSVSAISTDGADSAATTASLQVTVSPDVDAPVLTVTAASGEEDSAIALDITAALTDPSETLSVEISNLPEGASLSAGTLNADGSVTLTPSELVGLTVTPAADDDGDFTLTIEAISSDGAVSATTTATLPVTVAPVADAPILDVTAAAGAEDTAIALDIAAALTDPSEVLSVTISDIPDGATLSAGTANADGSVTLSPLELTGLTVTPPENGSEDFTLSVTAISLDGIDAAQTTLSLPVTVAPVADAPVLNVTAAAGAEDTAIALDIAATLTDPSEVLSVTISDIPDGATLSAGTANEDGSVTLSPGELAGLTITPAPNSSDDFTLTVTAASLDGDDVAQTTATLPVAVTPVADAPSLSVQAAVGAEDTAIALDVAAALTDSSEVLSVTISDIPNGATLSAGTVNEDGSVTINPIELTGLTITPAADSSDDFTLTVTATSLDGIDVAETTAALPVSVTPAADAPVLNVTAAVGFEDTAIALDIAAALTDASEVLSVTISDIPSGATLSAGTANEDGSVTLSPGELAGLTITPAANSSDDFTLTVTAASLDGDDVAQTTATLPVTVAPVADAPSLGVAAASGDAGGAIDLEITAGLTDASEILSLTISGIPDGASLSAGVLNVDGSVSLQPGDLPGLQILPAPGSIDDFDLTVTATSTDGADSASTSAVLPVTVTAVAPVVSGLSPLTVQATPGLVAHELLTDTLFDDLPAGTANGIVPSDLELADDHPVTATFISETAEFRNTIGYYKIDEDGQIVDVDILWENASSAGSGGDLIAGVSSAALDVSAGDKFGIFLVANGFGFNNFNNFQDGSFAFVDGAATATIASTNPSLVFIGADGVESPVFGPVFHTGTADAFQPLNFDGLAHVVSGLDGETGGLTIGFEDLPNLGDRDFDDAVIRIDFGLADSVTLDPVAVAPDVNLAGGSGILSAATVEITDGFAAGDSLQTGALDGTGISVAGRGFDDATGVYRLSLTGDATSEVYESVLASVQLVNTSETVTAGTRSLAIQVTDDLGTQSDAVAGSISVEPVTVLSGSDNADTLSGDAGNDRIEGGSGDDLLIGGGGFDVLRGDAGDDRLVIGDGSFVLASGGAGTDTLEIDFDLDLSAIGDLALSGIERFDLGGGAGAQLTIGLDDVQAASDGVNALTGNTDTLVINRDADDNVIVLGDDISLSQDTLDADNDGIEEGYTVFTDNTTGAAVYVENVV